MVDLTDGIGLKPEHYNDALRCRVARVWFEVYAENYMVDGGPKAWLEANRGKADRTTDIVATDGESKLSS